jgi:hypothetical protein
MIAETPPVVLEIGEDVDSSTAAPTKLKLLRTSGFEVGEEASQSSPAREETAQSPYGGGSSQSWKKQDSAMKSLDSLDKDFKKVLDAPQEKPSLTSVRSSPVVARKKAFESSTPTATGSPYRGISRTPSSNSSRGYFGSSFGGFQGINQFQKQGDDAAEADRKRRQEEERKAKEERWRKKAAEAILKGKK